MRLKWHVNSWHTDDAELLDCTNNSKIDVIVGVDEKMQVYTIKFEHVNGVRRLQFRAELTLLS